MSRRRAEWVVPLGRWSRRMGGHRVLAVVFVGLLAFGLAAAITAIRVPVPRYHDEFSYLLAADTFANGRLTNPTHPLHEHFETFHVLQEPSYASKYPPAQGLVLALGEVLGGHPIVGVWIAGALAAAGCCWMLQGWVPGRYALLGGLLIAFHHSLQFGWQNYWNGSLALLGGALLFGAAPRLWRRPRVAASLAGSVGIVLLANTRPFLGAVATLPVAAALAVRMLGPKRLPPAVSLKRIALPALCVLGVGAAAMGHYNARVTGDPLLLPYQAHSARYAYTPVFLWQEPRTPPPAYPNEMLRSFYMGWQADGYFQQRSPWTSFLRKRENLYFYLTPLLMLPLLSVWWVLRSRRNRLAAGTVLLVFAASLGVSGTHAHYLAPVAPLLFLLVVQGLRQLYLCTWRGRAWGPALVLAVLAAQIAIFGAALPLYAMQEVPAWALRRAEIEAKLLATPGRHLVVVDYARGHSPHEEWVANAADIDAAKVVWARTLSPAADRRLAAWFSDRRLWRVRPDSQPVELLEMRWGEEPGARGP